MDAVACPDLWCISDVGARSDAIACARGSDRFYRCCTCRAEFGHVEVTTYALVAENGALTAVAVVEDSPSIERMAPWLLSFATDPR